MNKKEYIYEVKCTDSILELLAVPQPFVGKLYGYDTRPERHKPNEIQTIGLLNQYGSGKLMDMFQNTLMDDTNKVGYLFYFLKEEQYWRDNFMVLNRLLAKVLLCCIGINECGNESNSKPKTRMATIVVLC